MKSVKNGHFALKPWQPRRFLLYTANGYTMRTCVGYPKRPITLASNPLSLPRYSALLCTLYFSPMLQSV